MLFAWASWAVVCRLVEKPMKCKAERDTVLEGAWIFSLQSSSVSAKRMHAGRGTFVVGNTESLWDDSRFRDADVVIGLGILHHLDDNKAEHCIRFAHRALKQGGRFVCFEACWVPNQGFLSRYIMSKDPGQNIRTEQVYRQLAGDVFTNVNAWVDTKPLRIPYVMIFLECQK